MFVTSACSHQKIFKILLPTHCCSGFVIHLDDRLCLIQWNKNFGITVDQDTHSHTHTCMSVAPSTPAPPPGKQILNIPPLRNVGCSIYTVCCLQKLRVPGLPSLLEKRHGKYVFFFCEPFMS